MRVVHGSLNSEDLFAWDAMKGAAAGVMDKALKIARSSYSIG